MIEFQENDSELYQLAKTNRFLKEYDWLEVPETKERFVLSFIRNCTKIYYSQGFPIKRKKYICLGSEKIIGIDDYTWLERHNKKTTYKWSISEYAKKYTYENCVEISKQYKSLKEFKDNDPNMLW